MSESVPVTKSLDAAYRRLSRDGLADCRARLAAVLAHLDEIERRLNEAAEEEELGP